MIFFCYLEYLLKKPPYNLEIKISKNSEVMIVAGSPMQNAVIF